MGIRSGSRLGPYEVVGPLGAGGMGEVYRARDTRLNREVAVKVLPPELSSDSDRLRRFEKEAQAASSLNHPNLVTIYEVERIDSTSFIVMELVAGKTLRELVAEGPLPLRRLLGIASQIADGLARAHSAGIVHRDLKPENVMVTKEGLVKILDFGLAKLEHPELEGGHLTQTPTVSQGTRPGIIMGTVGYMSPEQASGHPVDFRSDQFSFGSLLYEMATGKAPFRRATAAQTLAAIIQDEPESVASVNPKVPPPLRWVIERCLAKDARERYASTNDLAREIATIRDHLSEALSGGIVAAATPRRRTIILLALAALAAVAGALWVGRSLQTKSPPQPQYQRLTFRRGFVDAARFSPDGHTIVYSARWDGDPPHIFVTRPEGPESQKLLLPNASRLSVSPRGELAIVIGKMQIGSGWLFAGGTLATVPLGGGAPREIATDVQFADWAPDGKQMLIIRGSRLEAPPGKVLHPGTVILPRFSPRGDSVAFVAGPAFNRVRVVDLVGKELFVSKEHSWIRSLVWSPSGHEIWFTEGGTGGASGVGGGSVSALRALTLSGKERVLLRMPRGITIEDVSREGRILLGVSSNRWEVWAQPAGETRERDLTVVNNSDAMGLSPDGKTLLINDLGAFYLRGADGSPPKRLGEGTASELSADGKWAVLVRPTMPSRLVLVPTGAGEERVLESGGIEEITPDNVRWSSNGSRLLFAANERGHRGRYYVQDFAGGRPRPVTPEGCDEAGSISPDGRFVTAQCSDDGTWLHTVDGGERRRLQAVPYSDFVSRNWSPDGHFVYVWNPSELPFQVFRVEVATGRREPWTTIRPQDPAGIWNADLMLTPDGKSYAYTARRSLSDLYLVDGLK